MDFEEFKYVRKLAGAIQRAVPEPDDRFASHLQAKLLPLVPRKRFVFQHAVKLAIAACLVLAAGGALLFHSRLLRSAIENDTGWCFVEYDAGNSRHSLGTTPCAPDDLLWQTSLPDNASLYKPLAWNKFIIAGTGNTGDAALCAYDAATGNPAWRTALPSGDYFKNRRFPDRCIVSRKLYVTNGRECMVLDPADGRITGAFAPPSSSWGWSYLAADKERVYGLSSDGRRLFALGRESGKPLWTKTFESQVQVPAVAGGFVLCHEKKGRLTAVATATGQCLWQAENTGIIGTSTVHAYGRYAAVLGDNDRIALFDIATGKMAWTKDVTAASQSGVAMGEDALYLRNGSAAFNLATGNKEWDLEESGANLCASPTIVGNQVLSLTGSGLGTFKLLDASGGILKSLKNSDAGICGGAIVLGGQFFAVGSSRIQAFGCSKG